MSQLDITAWAVIVIIGIAALFLWANRPRQVAIAAPLPVNFPERGFAHDSFEELLQRYVTDEGKVNYEAWHRDPASRDKLRGYLAAVGHYSPENAAHRFPRRSDQLAYWLYAYNAYVIHAVLENWPLESVIDLKAPVEIVTGLGFFYQQRFSFGGDYLSLYTVETEKIRKRYRDPRIHFVLNCASASCPVVRPQLPTGTDLDALLEKAEQEFVNDPANVAVDHESKTIYLSSIFKWYEKDFVNSLRREGAPTQDGLVTYIRRSADVELARELDRARDYDTAFRDYDWGINSTH
jgi:hypothetical protein